jgi:uncharacterized protein with PIN domain
MACGCLGSRVTVPKINVSPTTYVCKFCKTNLNDILQKEIRKLPTKPQPYTAQMTIVCLFCHNPNKIVTSVHRP